MGVQIQITLVALIDNSLAGGVRPERGSLTGSRPSVATAPIMRMGMQQREACGKQKCLEEITNDSSQGAITRPWYSDMPKHPRGETKIALAAVR